MTSESWLKIGLLGSVFLLVNQWQFGTLVRQWLGDPNWTHGFIIPLFSLFLIYNWRDELQAAPRRVCLWGLPVIVLGLLVQLFGLRLIQNNWISQLSMPILLFGMVLYLAGPRVAWLLFVPIFFLVLAMPIPESLYNQIAYPLQNFAARMSSGILRLFGTELTSQASHMEIVSLSGQTHPLTVAEACSGVRSLMAFVALGVALAYLERRPFWERAIIVLAAIPITILCNVLRVTITSLMFVIDKPELGKEFMHTFTGMVLLIPALFLLFGLGKLLSLVYVEEQGAPDASEDDADGTDPLQAYLSQDREKS
jgi:exosortase